MTRPAARGLTPTPPPEGAVLLSYPEAAHVLRCSVSHVYKQIAEGLLAYRKMGRKSFIHRQDLDAYIESCRCIERPAEVPAPAPEWISLRAAGLWKGDDFGIKRAGRKKKAQGPSEDPALSPELIALRASGLWNGKDYGLKRPGRKKKA